MPNWVTTNYTFVGEKKEITDFHSKIVKWTSEKGLPNGFGKCWLGNVLNGAGLADFIDAKVNGIRCRGTVCGWTNPEEHFDEVKFSITTSTAWAPMTKMWKSVIEKLNYSTIRISYISEGDSGEDAVKYDPLGVYPCDWYVDCELNPIMSVNDLRPSEAFAETFLSSEDFIKAVSFLLNVPEEELRCLEPDELVEKALSYPLDDEDNYFSIYKYETLSEGNAFSE